MDDDDDNDGGGGREDNVDMEPPASSTLLTDRIWTNPSDPEQEVTFTQKVKGFAYGSQLVPVSPTDEEMFKIQGEGGVQLLGFVPADSVPR